MILTVTMNPSLDKVYLVDDYQVGKVFRPKAMTATAGGKGINVTRVASILGAPVTATGLLGGSIGSIIASDVANLGVVERFVRIPGETRICINVVDEKTRTSTEILEPGPEVSEYQGSAFVESYDRLLDDCQVVVASGSLPRGLPVDFYGQLVRLAKRKGKAFILDTSGEYLKAALREAPFMIKPNQDELWQIAGENLRSLQDCASVLMRIKQQGVHLPVLTLGKDGCLAALSDGVYHFFAPPVEVVNTVGSGDSFVAGVAVALSRGVGEQEAIVLGMACGMANTQYFQTGVVSVKLVEEYKRLVMCEKLASY
jgi:tagatose 6-phosphate kinase